MEFHAQTIMQHANFSFVLPNDVEMEEVFDKSHYERDTMNLILLHGLTGTDTDWLYGGVAQEMAIQYNINVFMPTTGNSFYLNKSYSGADYADFIAKELPAYIRQTFGIRMKRENTIIGGLSMGGYGAIRTALAYPNKFFACIGLSGAMHLKEIAEDMAEGRDGLMSVGMLRSIFGEPEKLRGSDKDPEYLYSRLKKSGKIIPKIYFACGTEDSLVTANRRFRDFLEANDADFVYEEGPGAHNWTFWNKYINKGLANILGSGDK